MRTLNTLKNSAISIGFYLFVLIIGFIVPGWIISIYGSEVNGLTSNITQVINMINLLQVGIIGASIYELFKPISEENNELIGRIYYSSKSYFKKVSWIFLLLTFLIIPYILLGKNMNLNSFDVVISVILLGVNGTFNFRYYCSYDVIFSAFQQRYILIIASVLDKVVYYFLLFIILSLRLHYVYMYLVVIAGTFFKVLYLFLRFKKLYLKKIQKWENYTDYKVKNQQNLLSNQIIQQVVEASPIIIVTSTNGLALASVLSIYILVINLFKTIFSALINSVSASFGDLIAGGNWEKTMSIFNIIQFVFTILSILGYICVMLLLLPFVKLYSFNITDQIYIYKLLCFFITIHVVFYTHFTVFNMIINNSGLYAEISKGNFIIGIISLFLSFILSSYNFQFVFVGTGIYYFLCILLQFIILKKNGFKLKYPNLLRVIITFILVAMSSLFIDPLFTLIESWSMWLIYAFVVLILTLVVTICYIFLFDIKEAKNTLNYFKMALK